MHKFLNVYNLSDVLVLAAVHIDKEQQLPPPPTLRTRNKLDFNCTSCS